MSCEKCGGPVGELRPELRRAKERLGMPLTPPKVCDRCLWKSLEGLADDPVCHCVCRECAEGDHCGEGKQEGLGDCMYPLKDRSATLKRSNG